MIKSYHKSRCFFVSLREELFNKYYLNWKEYGDAWENDSDDKEYLINLYNQFQIKLNEFIEELERIKPTITKKDFKANYRQEGGYRRCMVTYPDEGWKKKSQQFLQAYKELTVDFLYYSPQLEYEEMSLHEIEILENMAKFLIREAKKNTNELKDKPANEIELNHALYEECKNTELNVTKIEELLKMGANPLGSISELKEPVWEELICDAQDGDIKLSEITRIFMDNGMVIRHSDFSKDNTDDEGDPIWCLEFVGNVEGMKTLKVLLDYVTDYHSIDALITHIDTDDIWMQFSRSTG